MTPPEVDAILRTAEEEFARGESVMLITPLAVIGLVEQMRRCEAVIAALDAYDQLHD